jgi:phage regulator Rha-like protein
MDNIFLGMSNAMDSLLFYERELKRIPPFHNSFDSKFDVLKLRLAGRHGIDKEQIMLMQDIKSMISQHKDSPVEFARKDKFVICSEEYALTSVSLEQMKTFIKRARRFLDKVNEIIGDE